MKTRKFLLPVATAGVLALTLSACGGGGGGGTTAGGGDAANGLDGRGPITYVQGKDNNSVVRPMIEKWNAAHPNEKVTFKEQTDQADQQHDDLVQHFQAKDANYDVVSVDVVWTAAEIGRIGARHYGKLALSRLTGGRFTRWWSARGL